MKNKDFALGLGSNAVLAFLGGKLYIDTHIDNGDWFQHELTPEKAREMKSLIDMYLYSLYVTEANI